jgi:hypothetical protein
MRSMIRWRGARLLLLTAVLVCGLGCGSSKGVVSKDAAPDTAPDLTGEAPAETRPEAPPPEPAPDARVDLPAAPDAAPDAAADLAPDVAGEAAPDRPTAPDAAPDLPADRGPPDAAVEHAGLTLSFNGCVVSNVYASASAGTPQVASVVAADFDHDGKADVAVATWYDNRVVTLKGKGDGTFQIVTTKMFATLPRGLCLADLDGDGTPDVVAGGPAATSVNVMRGGPGCTIADPVSYAGTTAGGIAAGDVDNDGFLDLVVGNLDGTLSLGIFLGTGTGALAPVYNVRTKPQPLAPALGDFDRDGNLDVVVWATDVDSSGDYGLLVLHGYGDATFDPPAVYPTPGIPNGSVVGDFTSDGLLDIVTFYETGSNTAIMAGNGDGSFQPSRSVGPFVGGSGAWAVADFDLDGNLDIATPGSGNMVTINRGKGDGTFMAGVSFYASVAPGTLTASDFDGDGKPDLLIGLGSSIPVLCALKNTSR